MHLDAISQALGRQINGTRASQFAVALNEYDRFFTSSSFAQGSAWLVERFREAGCVDAEIVDLPADGETRMQDWTMPLAWECTAGELRLVEPGSEVLACRSQEPRCVAQWSHPTAGEVRAGLHLLEPDVPYPAGSFVLTDKHPSEVVSRARQAMPAAFITDFVAKGYPDHRTMWINAMSEEPGLWGVLARQITAPVFVIPPATGRRLREMLRSQPVMLAGRIDGRVGPGVMTCATAVTEGERRDQEIVIFAHGYEAGVIDNDSGVAAIVEAATALGELIRSGVLPKPKRSIRWLVVNECYGMVGFYTVRAELAKRGVVGLYLDTVGDASRPDYPFVLHRTGAATPSFANALFQLVLERMPAERRANYHVAYEDEVPVADHMISDPMVGIVSPWLGRGKEFGAWHSSDDVAGLIDDNSMYGSAFLAAAFAYFAASAGDEEAAWLAEQSLPVLEAELQERVKDGNPQREAFWRWALRRCAESAGVLADKESTRLKIGGIAQRFGGPADFVPEPAAELADASAARLVPVRNTWGTVTFESIPLEQRTMGSPRWSEPLNDAWFWADGRYTVGQIATLVSLELGQPVRKNIPTLFTLGVQAGLCRLKHA